MTHLTTFRTVGILAGVVLAGTLVACGKSGSEDSAVQNQTPPPVAESPAPVVPTTPPATAEHPAAPDHIPSTPPAETAAPGPGDGEGAPANTGGQSN